MSEIRIEKVFNGYIVRDDSNDDHSTNESTTVYSDFMDVVYYLAGACNEAVLVERVKERRE